MERANDESIAAGSELSLRRAIVTGCHAFFFRFTGAVLQKSEGYERQGCRFAPRFNVAPCWHYSCSRADMPWHPPTRLLASVIVPSLFTLLAVSCGDSGTSEGPSESCDALYEGFEASDKPTFVADVLPVMQESCNLGPCHGGDDPAEAAGELWLGRGPDEEVSKSESDFIYRSLIDVESVAAPGVALVRKEKPQDSFFMLKLDDCQDFAGVDCVLDPDKWGAPCGEVMPLLSDELSAPELDMIRSWIASGAAYE